MNWILTLVGLTAVLLLVADVLAFHDLFEAHTVRDWLVLGATGLAIVALVGESFRMAGRRRG